MNKRIFKLLIALLLLSSLLIGCSSGEDNKTTNGKYSGDIIETEEEFREMYFDPDKYSGANIEFPIRIIGGLGRGESGPRLQGLAYDKDNLSVAIEIDTNIDLNSRDIAIVKGQVEGVEGEGRISLVNIKADSIEKVDYVSAFSPAIKTVEINEEIDQDGYVMGVEKIEFAEKETRIYINVINNTEDNIRFSNYQSKLIQGSNQFKEKEEYNRDYPEIDSEVFPGVTEEGIIVFPKIDREEDIRLYLVGRSDDFDIKYEPFIFEIKELGENL